MRPPAPALAVGFGLVALLVGGRPDGAASPVGQETSRHTGQVAAVLPSIGRLAIDEMSPGVRLRRVEVEVGPGTEVVRVAREPEEVVLPASGDLQPIVSTYRWVERPIDLADVRPGDFAVVDVRPAPAGGPAPAARVAITARGAP